MNIDGIGETQINSLKIFFSNNTNIKVVKELQKILDIKDAIEVKNDGILANKTFMITGKLKDISRAEMKFLGLLTVYNLIYSRCKYISYQSI